MQTVNRIGQLLVLLLLTSKATIIQAQTLPQDDDLTPQKSVYVCKVDSSQRTKENKTLFVTPATAQAIISANGYLGPCAVYGDKRSVGNGYLQTYVQLRPDGSPWAIGFEFPDTTLQGLPTQKYDGANCYDINGNGVLDIQSDTTGGTSGDECIGGHEWALSFPALQKISPFKWGLVNWQTHGHIPFATYDKPHFDFHFFTQTLIERNFIRVGPCALVVNCDDMVIAQKPIPADYSPPGYVGVGAVEARMGDHLINLSGSEWQGAPFTETWIYGAYDGKLTFWEPMITNEYLESKPSMCKELILPLRYQESGYYPTRYCIRYRAERRDYTVSLEGFVYRAAN